MVLEVLLLELEDQATLETLLLVLELEDKVSVLEVQVLLEKGVSEPVRVQQVLELEDQVTKVTEVVGLEPEELELEPVE